jgi:hypothetical protein
LQYTGSVCETEISTPESKSEATLSTGAIVGIGVGALGGLLLLGLIIFIFVHWRAAVRGTMTVSPVEDKGLLNNAREEVKMKDMSDGEPTET